MQRATCTRVWAHACTPMDRHLRVHVYACMLPCAHTRTKGSSTCKAKALLCFLPYERKDVRRLGREIRETCSLPPRHYSPGSRPAGAHFHLIHPGPRLCVQRSFKQNQRRRQKSSVMMALTRLWLARFILFLFHLFCGLFASNLCCLLLGLHSVTYSRLPLGKDNYLPLPTPLFE